VKALDTNVIVRFLVNDDRRQGARAKRVLAHAESSGEPLLVTDLGLLELIWVLTRTYAFEREEALAALELLAGMPALCFEDHELVTELIARGRESAADLPDLLIGLRAAALGCDETLTFEKRLPATGLFATVKTPSA
jgi:predicted nucleic-acid-binding protein